MITAINAKNQADYLKLFREASDALIAAGKLDPAYGAVDKATFDPDTYVPGYYYTQDASGNYVLATGAYDPTAQYYFQTSAITTLEEYYCNLRNLYDLKTKHKFLMLPLDEEMFEIDANTRTITVPPNYRKAGIGVQGDTIAETLLFKIDRFFDTMDFNNTEIFVQWESADKDPQQYVTPIEMIDIETYADEGKLVFGWPISDNLTLTSGNIKFSVRFLKMDATNKIVYSFSTLTAQAVINPGLNFDINKAKQDDHSSSLFENSIENSESSVGVQAAPPIFLNKISVPVYMTKSGDTYSSEMTYSVSVADLGGVTYKWYYKPTADAARIFLGAEGDASATMVEGKNHLVRKVFSLTKDTSFKADKNYYVKDGAGYVRYAGDAASANMGTLYERYTTLTISGDTGDIAANGASPVTGYYYVEATNRLGTREKTTRSDPFVHVPAPVKPEITTQLPAYAIADVNNGVVLTAGYKADTQAEVSLDWKYSSDNSAWSADTSSTGASITAKAIGYYKADVVSLLNLGRATETTSVVKVTHAPVAPQFATGFKDADKDQVINLATDEKIEVQLADGIIGEGELYTENITYKWYGNTDDQTSEDSYTEYLVTTEPVFPLTKDYAGPDKVYCKAVNQLSGKTATSEKSCLFVIITA